MLPEIVSAHPWVASVSAVCAMFLLAFLIGQLGREYGRSPNAHHHVTHFFFSVAVLAVLAGAAYLNGFLDVGGFHRSQITAVTSHEKSARTGTSHQDAEGRPRHRRVWSPS